MPNRIETEDGRVLFTADNITAGKEVFLKYNLMSYGTLLGNGAYYGPDYTAEYLSFVSEQINSGQTSDLEHVRGSQPIDGILQLPQWWAELHTQARAYYEDFYVQGNLPAGIGPGTIPTSGEAHRFADYVAWTAWISIAERPGNDGSYTNNWPYEPRLGNVPTPKNLFWTAATIAIVMLLAAVIILLYEHLEVESIPNLPTIQPPGDQEILPAQKAAIPLFAISSIRPLFSRTQRTGGELVLAWHGRNGIC